MIRNEYEIKGKETLIFLETNKFGKLVAYIDTEDLILFKDKRLYPWSTPRHPTIYLKVQIEKGKNLAAHRVIKKYPKGKVIDHINGNGLDNRKLNLRVTDHVGNNANARKRKNARTSKFKGVHFSKAENKWKSQIQFNNKKYNLGTYKTEFEAAEAYNLAATKLNPGFYKLNKLNKENL